MAEESVRDILINTIADSGNSEGGTPAPSPAATPAPSPTGTPAAAPASDYLAGSPAAPAAPTPPAGTPAATPVAQGAPKTEATPDEPGVKQNLGTVISGKAPGTWSPAAREHWAALPPEVQQEVARRESETSRAMTQSTQARRFQQQFQQTIQPHLPFFAADGVDPLTGINQVMQQAATLRVGSMDQKAKLVANLINHFQVDLDMLDQILAGAQNPQSSQGGPQGGVNPSAIQQMINQAVAPLIQQSQQAQQRILAEVGAEVDNELSSFRSQHEFYDDLKDVMADLMEVQTKRGINMTLTEAYERATLLVPSVREVVEKRKQIDAAKSNQQVAQKAKAGGFGIQNSAETVVATPAGDDSIRGLLTAQFAAQQGGR